MEEEENLIRLESIDGFGEVLNHVVRESEETLVASVRPKCQHSSPSVCLSAREPSRLFI